MVDYYRVEPNKIVDLEVKVKGVIDPDFKLGYVIDTDQNNRILFGLVYRDRLTHMCYGADYFDPHDMLTFEFPEFYFDAGGNGRPVTVEKEEFVRALKELGLIDNDRHV